MTSTLAALLLALAQGGAEPQPAEWADCLIVHYRADGTRTETPPRSTAGAGSNQPSSARSNATGGGSSRSTVFASSRDGVSTSASATSSGDGPRRSVTQTRENGRCVVTVDER